jgi:putative DNA primase/helicase
MLTPKYEGIPPELKSRHQWVLWKVEKRDGKPTKVPYNPVDPTKKAESNNPETWGEFDRAKTYWESHKGNGIAGIGYMFSFYDSYTGVDLDKCREP